MKEFPCGSLRNVIVVVSACLITFLTFGAARLSAQLFVACIERYATGRKEASLPFILCYTVRNLSGPIVGYLGNKYGLKSVTLSGCFLAAVGVGGCYFVESIVPFTVLWGGCFGIGFGVGTILIPNILHLYFKENFNKMYGIALSSGCLGSLVLPVLTDSLMKHYGFSGTLLILSSLILHCVPAAMLLNKPERPQTHKSKNKVANQIGQQNVKVEATKRCENSLILNGECRDGTTENAISQSKSNSLQIYEQRIGIHNDLETKTNLKTTKIDLGARIPTESKIFALPIFHNVQVVENIENVTTVESHIPTEIILNKTSNHIEFQEILSDTQIERRSESSATATSLITVDLKSKTNKSGISQILKRKKNINKNDDSKLASTSALQKFEIFLDPAYILILLSVGFTLVVATTMYTVIVDTCRDKGIAEDLTILMTFAFTDMLGRFGFGYMADGGYISPLNIYALCYGSWGSLFIGFIWFSNFYTVLIFVAGFGFLMGGIFVLPIGVISNYIQKENLTMAFSSRYFLFAFLSFSQSPIIGYFRGTLKSYNGLLYLLGCTCFLGTIITLLIPLAAKWRDNRKNSKNKVPSTTL